MGTVYSDRHDVTFLDLKKLVDLGDVFVRQILNVCIKLLDHVFGHAFLFKFFAAIDGFTPSRCEC
jgi:hypothetical protein